MTVISVPDPEDPKSGKSIPVPGSLADLQRSYDEAREAIGVHRRGTQRPVPEWDEETRAESDRLLDAWRAVAVELREGIEESGLEAEFGAYKVGRALRKAAYGLDYDGK
ncbi:hypothetical protein ACFWVC_07945 [Streptomyces sp. NPDC058691]|uniref:hypothetical protein n=1 Tax=Streptomyces sp. NPDC058691 TaxID=3346601 RepID=UPI0036490766